MGIKKGQDESGALLSANKTKPAEPETKERGFRRLVDDLRDQYPGLAKKAATGSRQAAIRLFCLECLGGSFSDVRDCCSTKCPLWQYRMGRGCEPLPEEPVY